LPLETAVLRSKSRNQLLIYRSVPNS